MLGQCVPSGDTREGGAVLFFAYVLHENYLVMAPLKYFSGSVGLPIAVARSKQVTRWKCI